jgi:hypothetical protein
MRRQEKRELEERCVWFERLPRLYINLKYRPHLVSLLHPSSPHVSAFSVRIRLIGCLLFSLMHTLGFILYDVWNLCILQLPPGKGKCFRLTSRLFSMPFVP